ncbi:MAG: aminotransferase class I/II-fold pyridoxal phosphate-dependent enzyme [bacterium]|nr:aminotransferase class I/II-fold pyridoxal phosphate-dependent enzyme [bacterium]
MDRAPLVAALATYLQSIPGRLHLPAHKGGRWADAEFHKLFTTHPWELDLTELPGLDDLHAPIGPLREAQELAARAFGAAETLFLVNGSTAGILALILATTGPGETLVLARNCHRAATGGLILSRATPAWVPAEIDARLGLAVGVTPEALEETIRAHPAARAVLLVSPTYQGFAPDLRALAATCHARGLPLLVDEAHGPHFGFHPGFPPPALAAGADACVQSLHKAGGSLTGTALLHLAGDRLDRDRVRLMASLVQTTSPSFPLLASLDAARRRLAVHGRGDLDRALNLAADARSQIRELGLDCPGTEYAGRPGVAGVDPTRLLVHVGARGITGYRAEDHLRQQAGVQVEYADPANLLALVSPGDEARWLEALVAGLAGLPRGIDRVLPLAGLLTAIPRAALSPAEALDLPRERIPLSLAAGRVAAELVCPYPPGLPVLVPGEVIPPGLPETLEALAAAGCRFQGPNPAHQELAVLA